MLRVLDGIEQEAGDALERKIEKKRPIRLGTYVLFADSSGLLVWEKIELFDGDGVDDRLCCVRLRWIIECTR